MREWLNTKLYSITGNRLAVFGREISDNQIEIFELECSRKDQFSKKTARVIYNAYLQKGMEYVNSSLFCKPKTQIISPVNEDSLEYTFFNYCNKTYCKLFYRTRRVYTINSFILSPDGNIKKLKSEPDTTKSNKMF